ncbi:MAG TPA: XRE family transcriptional regulator [Gammaproteobacteria bacterium]
MAKSFKDLRKKMSPASRSRADAMARELAAEMPLQELRRARRISQEQIAQTLHVKQASVSRMEHRADMYIGTLRRVIRAMGGDLELRAVFPDGEVRIAELGGIEKKQDQ